MATGVDAEDVLDARARELEVQLPILGEEARIAVTDIKGDHRVQAPQPIARGEELLMDVVVRPSARLGARRSRGSRRRICPV